MRPAPVRDHHGAVEPEALGERSMGCEEWPPTNQAGTEAHPSREQPGQGTEKHIDALTCIMSRDRDDQWRSSRRQRGERVRHDRSLFWALMVERGLGPVRDPAKRDAFAQRRL